MMDICVIGAGYVGLTTSAMLAELGHDVVCIDKDQTKIEQLNQGNVPIYEQGLERLLKNTRKKKRLKFSHQIEKEIGSHSIIFIAVGTPSLEDGRTDLRAIQSVTTSLAAAVTSYKIIIMKSTVPPGTNQWIGQQLIERGVSPDWFDIVSNPEFLKEGTAVKDSFHPNRIVIGTSSKRPVTTVKSIYQQLNAPVIVTSLAAAELIKYASNTFLAAKISFINELSRICDVFDADILEVEKGMALDPRIGPHFIRAGLGYGGSCFPKDLSALKYIAEKNNIYPAMINAVIDVNKTQIDTYVNKLTSVLTHLQGKRLAVWGITFKPNTDDTRSSQSIGLVDQLLKRGAELHVYDPMIDFQAEGVTNHSSPYDSVRDADCLIIATEWPAFATVNWQKIQKEMKGNLIMDCRNFLDLTKLQSHGFHYLGVGRP